MKVLVRGDKSVPAVSYVAPHRLNIALRITPLPVNRAIRIDAKPRGVVRVVEGTNWCTPHLQWLQHLTTDNSPLASEDRMVYREYHALLMYKLQRREELDRQIETLAELPTLKPMVAVLQCFRGISLHSAMVLATELVDWRRFERPGQLACYLGLISREDSSGNRQRLGSITKAGNSHCRHVLVQAAWSYRHRPQISVDRKRRQQANRPR